MKKTIILSILMLVSAGLYAQSKQQTKKVSRYKTFVYTSDKIDVLIQNEYKKQKGDTRGFLGDLGMAALNASKSIGGGYVTSVIDLGMGAIASLITKSSNDKLRWEEIVKAENFYQETLTTVEPINNFYSRPSFDGPMDPAGMNFNGIGCLRTTDGDTVFYISCHIDPAKINRIINHSKFELSLDTLIIDPYRLDLPNSDFDNVFSFEQRNNLQMIIEIRLVSSWINVLPELQKNQELGSFTVSIPVNPDGLDENGKLRYVRTDGTPAEYRINGECFIIPRSFMGFRDEENKYKDSWGTGDYKIELTLRETCNITDTHRKNWKADWKKRQDMENDENFMQRTWKTVSSQRWDEIGKQWVITTLKAPADMMNSEILEELNLTENTKSTGGRKESKY